MTTEVDTRPKPVLATNVKIKLEFPIDISGTVTNQLSMRRCKVKDRLNAEAIGGSEADKEVALLANLCEVTPDDIKELDWLDFKKLQNALVGFSGSAV